MAGLISLVFRWLAVAGVGYVANDVVDIVQDQAAAKKEGAESQPFDVKVLLARWQSQQFLIKFLIITLIGVLVAVVFMTKIQRRKLLK